MEITNDIICLFRIGVIFVVSVLLTIQASKRIDRAVRLHLRFYLTVLLVNFIENVFLMESVQVPRSYLKKVKAIERVFAGWHHVILGHLVSRWNTRSLLAWYWRKPWNPFTTYLGVEVMAIILPGAAHFEEIYNISQTMFIVVIIVPLAFTFFQTLFSIDARLAEVIPLALLDFNHENVCGRVFLLTVMLLIFLFISALSLNHVELRVHLHEKLQTDEHLLEDHADAMHAIFGAIFAMVFWSLSPDRRVGDNQGMSRAETEIDSNLMEFTPSSRGSNATPSSQLSSLASAEEPASPAVADHGNSETSRRSDATSRPQNSSRESLEAKATEGLPE